MAVHPFVARGCVAKQHGGDVADAGLAALALLGLGDDDQSLLGIPFFHPLGPLPAEGPGAVGGAGGGRGRAGPSRARIARIRPSGQRFSGGFRRFA